MDCDSSKSCSKSMRFACLAIIIIIIVIIIFYLIWYGYNNYNNCDENTRGRSNSFRRMPTGARRRGSNHFTNTICPFECSTSYINDIPSCTSNISIGPTTFTPNSICDETTCKCIPYI